MRTFQQDVEIVVMQKIAAIQKKAGIGDAVSSLYSGVMGSPWRMNPDDRNIEMLARYLGAGLGGIGGGLAAAVTGGASLLPALAGSAAAAFGGAGLGARICGALGGNVFSSIGSHIPVPA